MWWQRIFAKGGDDLDEEMQSHITMAIQDRIGRGESPEQARAGAVREFGNIPLIKDVAAQMSGGIWLNRLLGDMRYALRQLLKSPGFSITAILTLALAIGANTAIFTLVHAILLRQLPFDQPSRVFSVENGYAVGLDYNLNADPKNFAAAFNNAAQSLTTVDSAAMYSSGGVNADLGDGYAQRLQAAETSAQFLNVLGATPKIGRGFAPNEDVPGNDHVVLISDRLWRGAFRSDPAVLGKAVKLNGFNFTVVGVLPPRMNFPANTDLWAPTIFDEHTYLREGPAFITSVIVRAREGASAEAVGAEFDADAAHSREHGGRSGNARDEKPILTPIAAELTKSIRSSLLMLTLAVWFVLLIACANVACLLLVRTAERRGEFAVRAALGAGRTRLMQQQLVESIFIALAGGALGVFIAHIALHLLYLLRPAALDAFPRPALDPVVLAFTAALALATGLVFGIVPAWLASREDPAGALKTGVWRASVRGSRLKKALVAGEMAMAFVLLAGAGLLLRTIANMDRVSLGYDVEGILSFSVSLHGEPYLAKGASTPAVDAFYSSVLDRLREIPGVSAAAAVSNLPMDTRVEAMLPITAENTNQPGVGALARFSSSGYFDAMGIPIVEGRDFSPQDDKASPKVVIVTRDLAEKLWPGEDPIGRQIHSPFYSKSDLTVIGMIPENRQFGPRSNVMPEYFMPYTQRDWWVMTFVVRTPKDPAMLIPSVRRAVAQVDPTQPVYDIRTMRQRLDDNESLVRFELFTLCAFAIFSVLLASIGLYGVISYAVTRRTREIGLRIALGAQRAAILLALVREGAWIALAGIALGLAGSFALTRLLAAALYGVTPHDPDTLCAAALLFLFVAIAASYLPGRRAAAIDPASTLRSE